MPCKFFAMNCADAILYMYALEFLAYNLFSHTRGVFGTGAISNAEIDAITHGPCVNCLGAPTQTPSKFLYAELW